MRSAIAAAALLPILLLLSSEPGRAETCQEKFVRVMTERNNASDPVRIHVTQEIAGGMTSMNWNLQDGKGNWRTEMIDPENMPWSMVVGKAMYASMDKGKTWKKVRDLGPNESMSLTPEQLQERAATVRNTECGEEELDGVRFEAVAGEYEMSGTNSVKVREKFWIDPQDGFIGQSEMHMKSANFESVTTQIIEPAPGLEIVAPE